MASTNTLLVPENDNATFRVKMRVEENSLIPFVLVCHCGDTNNEAFPINGLVLSNETLVAYALRLCSHLAWIHLTNYERIYLC